MRRQDLIDRIVKVDPNLNWYERWLYKRQLKGITTEQFVKVLDMYLVWYGEEIYG